MTQRHSVTVRHCVAVSLRHCVNTSCNAWTSPKLNGWEPTISDRNYTMAPQAKIFEIIAHDYEGNIDLTLISKFKCRFNFVDFLIFRLRRHLKMWHKSCHIWLTPLPLCLFFSRVTFGGPPCVAWHNFEMVPSNHCKFSIFEVKYSKKSEFLTFFPQYFQEVKNTSTEILRSFISHFDCLSRC